MPSRLPFDSSATRRLPMSFVEKLTRMMQAHGLLVCLPVPTKVVVELHADGWVKVYGQPHVSVAMIQRPVETTRNVEALVDSYVDVFLPPGFRSVYWPTNLKEQGRVERLTIQELMDRLQYADAQGAMLKAVDGVGK